MKFSSLLCVGLALMSVGCSGVNDVSNTKTKVSDISSTKSEADDMSNAKYFLKLIEDMKEADADGIYADAMAHKPFTQSFRDGIPSSKVECNERVLDEKLAKEFERVTGSPYYSQICEFHVEDVHLATMEFLYTERDGEFLGLVDLQLMFE